MAFSYYGTPKDPFTQNQSSAKSRYLYAISKIYGELLNPETAELSADIDTVLRRDVSIYMFGNHSQHVSMLSNNQYEIHIWRVRELPYVPECYYSKAISEMLSEAASEVRVYTYMNNHVIHIYTTRASTRKLFWLNLVNILAFMFSVYGATPELMTESDSFFQTFWRNTGRRATRLATRSLLMAHQSKNYERVLDNLRVSRDHYASHILNAKREKAKLTRLEMRKAALDAKMESYANDLHLLDGYDIIRNWAVRLRDDTPCLDLRIRVPATNYRRTSSFTYHEGVSDAQNVLNAMLYYQLVPVIYAEVSINLAENGDESVHCIHYTRFERKDELRSAFYNPHLSYHVCWGGSYEQIHDYISMGSVTDAVNAISAAYGELNYADVATQGILEQIRSKLRRGGNFSKALSVYNMQTAEYISLDTIDAVLKEHARTGEDIDVSMFVEKDDDAIVYEPETESENENENEN